MSVSKLGARQAEQRGEHVTARHYVVRFHCPFCRKPYAKRGLYVKHIASHKGEAS